MCIFGIIYGKILKNGVIRAGVKGAGVKKGPAEKGPIRYIAYIAIQKLQYLFGYNFRLNTADSFIFSSDTHKMIVIVF